VLHQEVAQPPENFPRSAADIFPALRAPARGPISGQYRRRHPRDLGDRPAVAGSPYGSAFRDGFRHPAPIRRRPPDEQWGRHGVAWIQGFPPGHSG
jgi:hypothetical protein